MLPSAWAWHTKARPQRYRPMDKVRGLVTVLWGGAGRPGMPLLDWLQWPAMAPTLSASWLVTSRSGPRRGCGFWLFLLSNILWVAWGWQSGSWALVVLQVGLALMNIDGAHKNAA